MPRTAEINYINDQDHDQGYEQAQIICKACEIPMTPAVGAWSGGYCPDCYPAVKALVDLYLSDHRKHYNAIQTMAKREASWQLRK